MKINEILSEAFPSSGEASHALSEILVQNCGPYFNEVGSLDFDLNTWRMYRGVRNITWRGYDPYRIVATLQNRRPLTTPMAIHTFIDNWFLAKFGVRFRSNAMFCTGDEEDASSYGTVAIAVPMGQFSYAWSPNIGDLFVELSRSGIVDRVRNKEPMEEIIVPFLERADYKFNTGLSEAILSANEIMVSCKDVVMVNPDWANR